MASLAQTRTDVATVLSGVGGMTVRTRPVAGPKALDGWVNVGRITPGQTYTTKSVTFVAVLVLGSDERTAEGLIETLSGPVLDAVTTGPLHPDSVVIEPGLIPAGDVAPAQLYVLTLSLTLEVD